MRGFTLIEIVITIAIFSMLLGMGLIMSMETFRGTIYRSEEGTIVSLFERARSRAMNNINQSSWGVCYIAPNYVIFKGSSCSAPAVTDSIDANTSVASASNFSSKFPTVVFTQLSGTTTAPVGSPFNLAVTQDSRSDVISINNEGTIIW